MANMAEANRWIKTIGIFEYESTHHDAYDDDDWQDGFATDYIALDQYTDGTDALLNLIPINYEDNERPEIKFTLIPGRTTFPIGIGKGGELPDLVCACIDKADGSKYAEEYVNDIKTFSKKHDETGNNKIFLVMRRFVPDGSYVYREWQDNAGNYDKEYLQVKIKNVSAEYISTGYWEVSISLQEAWI